MMRNSQMETKDGKVNEEHTGMRNKKDRKRG